MQAARPRSIQPRSAPSVAVSQLAPERLQVLGVLKSRTGFLLFFAPTESASPTHGRRPPAQHPRHTPAATGVRQSQLDSHPTGYAVNEPARARAPSMQQPSPRPPAAVAITVAVAIQRPQHVVCVCACVCVRVRVFVYLYGVRSAAYCAMLGTMRGTCTCTCTGSDCARSSHPPARSRR